VTNHLLLDKISVEVGACPLFVLSWEAWPWNCQQKWHVFNLIAKRSRVWL